MTPTEVQIAIAEMAKLEKHAVMNDQPEFADVCRLARVLIGDLWKDRERLEWLINQECFLSRLPDWSCHVADVAGICEHPQRSTAREAIDEAMTQRGEG